MRSGFYKNDNGEILYGENFVINKEYELNRSSHEGYEYPIDGWYWFNSKEDAYAFFGLPLPPTESNPFLEMLFNS